MSKIVDISGKKYGKLSVIDIAGRTPRKQVTWNCVCDCGTKLIVIGCSLRSGNSKSCGCKKRESTKKRNKKHGYANRGKKTRLYNIWIAMRQRCSNPKHKSYDRYGGRGIRVCAEWNSFKAFRDWALKNHYHKTLSIERIDNNGNYEPNNCKWASDISQANNKINNRHITYLGQRKTLAEWSRLTGVEYS